jgi:glycosyltransferase involved in cell wall biosynthesis
VSYESLSFSVITVCYNGAETLGRALHSVAQQEWPNVEHIVIDGGSTDHTPKVLDEHKACLSYLISEPDRGIYDAMNKGLDVATGDVICFLNADDYYDSTQVLSKVATVMQQENLDAVLGDVGFFRKDNIHRLVRHYRSGRFTPERLAWGWMPAHPALFMRKEIFKRIGHFKIDYQIAADYEYVVRAFCGQTPLRYKHLPEVLVRMQMGGVSTKGIGATIRLNQEIMRACRENGVATNYLKILVKYPLKLLEFFRP